MARTGACALHVHELAKRYGRVQALRGISFSVEPGEVFGYLGPNGAGKTTTLRIIVGLVRADRGAVRLRETREAAESGPATAASHGPAPHGVALTRTGYLPGELLLYGGMTGRELLDYFARFRPGSPPVLRERLAEALELDPAHLSRRIKHLSHGTRQKLGIILALQHDPDLWVLDEPTLGLDPLVQQGFREILLEGAARGRAILLSSHVLSEVEAVSARVGILRDGALVAVEAIAALRENVVRRLTVRLRGAPPSDLGALPGVVRASAGAREATLWVRGDLNPIVRRLASLEIADLAFPEPELEDIFLGYYGRQEGGNA